MKAKIHKLSFEQSDDFELLGIVSSENDYKLSWELNQSLKIQLIRSNPLEIISNKHPVPLLFANYCYHDEISMVRYKLISNKGNDGFLVDDYKNIDFLFRISGELEDFDLHKTLNIIKNTPNIITVLSIDKSTLKKESLNRLNLD